MWFFRDFQICRTVPDLEWKHGRHLGLRAMPRPRSPLCSAGLQTQPLCFHSPGALPRRGEAVPHHLIGLRASEVKEETLGGEKKGAHINCAPPLGPALYSIRDFLWPHNNTGSGLCSPSSTEEEIKTEVLELTFHPRAASRTFQLSVFL